MQTLSIGPLEPSGAPTLIRTVARGLDGGAAERRLHHERDVAVSLSGVPQVLQPIRVEENAEGLRLVLSDPGTRPWSTLPRPIRRELGRFLRLAVSTTEAIAALHAERVMHLALCPSALRLGGSEEQVFVLGLGDASRLQTETAEAGAALAVAERLPYVAPEQTGRMNRAVDRRADLYALGVLLYEALTGELPLQAEDALGWVHAHLARRPRPPGAVLPGVPESVAAVLLKLLSKDVEERYRSAAGLLSDLRLLQTRWSEHGELGEFVPGQHDVHDSVRTPDRLYGRQAELRALEAAFAHATTGTPAVLWVTGDPGMGKSRLIRELDRPVTAQGGLFAQGKADQLRRGQPFDAPVQAFRGLLRQVLAWPEARLNELRVSLEAALGANTSVISDALPELAVVLPGRPPAPVLSGAEAELRFRLTFQRLVEVFATVEHPLCLFLDDLQWVDPASLTLVESLLATREGSALCLLGSWRTEEVGAGHPLLDFLSRLEAAGLHGPRIHLDALSPESLRVLVLDALGGPQTAPEAAVLDGLTALLVEKTGANPFFVGRFLQGLAADGQIAFDYESGRFAVDLAAIAQAGLADNVAEHIGRDLARLPDATQGLLQWAAALGSRFCVDDLTRASGNSASAVMVGLTEAVRAGFVQRTNAESGGTFQFVHDHLQSVAYARSGAHERAALHLTLARMQLGDMRPEDLGDGIFGVAHHFTRAESLLDTPALRHAACSALLAAGQRALVAGAPEGAVRFLRQGVSLLGDAPFVTAPFLSAELHIALATAERAHQNAEEALRLCDVVDAHATRPWDRVRTAELRIYLLNNLMRLIPAAEQALALSASLGYPVAPALSMDDMIACLGRCEVARAGRDPLSLAHLPELLDPEAAAVCRILATVLPSLAMGMPHMHVPAMTTVLEIGLTRGVTPDVAYATGHWTIIAAATGQLAYAYALGQLTDALRERFSDRPTIAGLVEVPMMAQHLSEPVRNVAQRLHWGARRSLDLGNPTGLGYCANQALLFDVMAGDPLPSLEQSYRRIRAAAAEHQQFLALPPIDTWGQLIACLQGDHAGDPARLKGARLDFEPAVADFRRIGVVTSTLYAVNASIWLATVFNEPERVLALAAEFAADLSAPVNLPAFGSVVVNFHVLLARLDTGTGLETEFPAELERLRVMARQIPENHGHRLALVEAGLALRRGDPVAAGAEFEAAFVQARGQHFLHDAALVAERAARAAETLGSPVLMRAWRREAIEAYSAWGATAKVARLREAWPDAEAGLNSTVERAPSRALDLDAVLRAAETIAGEMDLERLLARTMRLVCTAAGAERGALLLERDEALVVEAVAEGDAVEVLSGVPLARYAGLCPEVAQYVARSLEPLVLTDATTDARFARTPYVVERAPRSVLCVPLVHRGRRTGLLYLENSLTPGAFTVDRVEVLRLLAFQAATAIENAVLYAAASARAEELRAKNEALSAVDRLKDELLARTSHELRTPLHGIIGLAQTVAETGSGLDGPSRRSLDMIVSSGRRLANLINDILDFQTLKRREIALSLAAVPLREAVESVLDLCRPLMEGRPVTLRHALSDDEMLVFADADRLTQILLNLVGNAVKFTERGEVVVEVSPPRTGGDLVRVQVRDSGIGIASDVQARIFEGFEQGDAGIARRFGGAGLGLSVARQLVELHGGTLGVESTLGSGSTFFFTLPLARGEQRLSRSTDGLRVRERVTGALKSSQPTEIVAVSE